MKLRMVLFICLFLGACCILSAAPKKASEKASGGDSKELNVDESANETEVSLQKGQNLVVSLAENGSTGYRWTIEDFKPSILEQVESSYKPNTPGGSLRPDGSGGTRIFIFHAKRAGETLLKIAYQRPWAEGTQPAKEFSLKIAVRKTMGGKMDLGEKGVKGGIQLSQSVAGQSRSGSSMTTGMTLKELKSELVGLEGPELEATSVVEFRVGAEKEYVRLIIVKADNQLPRCPNEKLPMKNRALKNMVNKLLKAFGKKSEKMELVFLKGGFNPPGFCQVSFAGTALGLYFNTANGEPMGKLSGSL